MSRSLIAVIALTTVSTFSSDIAHAVSRGGSTWERRSPREHLDTEKPPRGTRDFSATPLAVPLDAFQISCQRQPRRYPRTVVLARVIFLNGASSREEAPGRERTRGSSQDACPQTANGRSAPNARGGGVLPANRRFHTGEGA